MLSETAMIVLVSLILIVMLVTIVKLYSLFEHVDKIASEQAYNRVLKAIESLEKDGDITYEYASLRSDKGILILNSEKTTQNSIMLFNPSTIGSENIDILEEYKKGTPKICYIYTQKNGDTRTIKINSCTRLKTDLDKNYIIEQNAIPLEIKKESSRIRIATSSTEYDPKQNNDPEASMLYYSYDLPSKMRNSETLIDLEVGNWFSLDATRNYGTIIVEKEGQYVLKGKYNENDEELTIANTYVDIGLILIASYYLDPLEDFNTHILSELNTNGANKEVKLSALENIGKLKIENLDRLEVSKLRRNDRPNLENVNNEFLQIQNLGNSPSDICAMHDGNCAKPYLKEFKKMYLYRIEGPYITLGFFILSDNDLEEDKFKSLIDDPHFQNKVKELVCGEENINDCEIF